MKPRKTYRTRQRDIVLSCFANQPRRGMTAQEAYEQLLKQGQDIGRATVYRSIALLVAQGQLVALQEAHGAGPARYQHRGNSRHISVRCSGCGLIAALTCGAVDAFERHLYQDHGFRLQEDECLLPGLCSQCQNQETTTPSRKDTV
ncbi:MAG: transcriptional repressor [Clostridiales bacterium]|nr:transcriptional repressor [Clostridiales bacterium]